MDRETALKQLRLLELTCGTCRSVAPSYRMMIGTKSPTPLITKNSTCRAQQQQVIEASDINQISTPQSAPSSAQLQYTCITCYSKQVNCHRDVSPFHQLALSYIKEMPLPDTAAAEHCLSALKQIEEQASQIIKQVMNSIDEFKFFVLRLVAEGTKECETYISKMKQMEKLKVEHRYLLEMQWKHATTPENKSKVYNQIKSNYFLNQTESNIKFVRKYKQMLQIKQKVGTIKLTMPEFQPSQKNRGVSKRKNLFVSDVPISSMATMKGRNYYGCSDGHIIFPVLTTGTHSAHKGHDSLIRSFTHDNQFTLYSGSDDFTIKGWDVRDGVSLKLIRTFGIFENNKSYHRNICIVEDGDALVSTRGQFDGFRIRVWGFQESTDNQSGAINKGVLQGHTSFIKAMAVVDKQANIIVTSSDDKTLKLWQTNKTRPMLSVPRPRKCQNLIVSEKYSLCCLVEQENKVSILDLQDNLSPVLMMTLPRKILCSSGYSRSYAREIHMDNDYIILCIPNCIGIYRWDLIRIKAIDVEVTFVPLACMQVGDSIVLSDGGGIVEEVKIGEITEIQAKALAEQQNQA